MRNCPLTMSNTMIYEKKFNICEYNGQCKNIESFALKSGRNQILK